MLPSTVYSLNLRGWWASGCLTVVYKSIQRNISCGWNVLENYWNHWRR